MPIHHTQLFFHEPINVSVQKGDTVYYVPTQNTTPPTPTAGTQVGTTFEINNTIIREVGQIHDILGSTIVCRFECNSNITGDCEGHLPSQGDFIMFSKDNAANMSSILGYYAEVEMTNDSDQKAKLFAVSSNISESSK
jgi:hypothetical protein